MRAEKEREGSVKPWPLSPAAVGEPGVRGAGCGTRVNTPHALLKMMLRFGLELLIAS